MKIKKPLGNNAILMEDENGTEQVAIGNGIGFRKREGDEVDPDKIQKVYVIRDTSILLAEPDPQRRAFGGYAEGGFPDPERGDRGLHSF